MTLFTVLSFLLVFANAKPNDGAKEDIFVFPSMQMTSLEIKPAGPKGGPEIFVNYRGEPQPPSDESGHKIEDKDLNSLPVYPTPIPKKRKKKKGRVKLKSSSLHSKKLVNSHGITPATWNPDLIDHTVNPHKSRKNSGKY